VAADVSGLGINDFNAQLNDEGADAVDSYWVTASSRELGKCLDQGEVWKVLSNVAGKLFGDAIEAAKLDERGATRLDGLKEGDCLITSLNGEGVLGLSGLESGNLGRDQSVLIFNLCLCARIVALSCDEGGGQFLKGLAVILQRGGRLCDDTGILLELDLVSGDNCAEEA